MNDTTYFECNVSKKQKERLISALNTDAIHGQIDMQIAMANAYADDRINVAKAKCKERRMKREYRCAAQMSNSMGQAATHDAAKED